MERGNVFKAGVAVLLLMLLLFLGAQIYSFLIQTDKAAKDFAELQGKLQQAKEDQNNFAAELNYYLNPENLKKEIKGRFNYKEPGEKVVILVNKSQSSSTASSTSQ